MSGPAAPPDLRARARRSGSKVARRVLDQPLRRIGLGGALVLLAATAAFGGLEEQTQDGPEVLTVGTPVDVAPFELTVHRVVWTTDLPGQYLSDEGNRWIAVVATVRNTSDAGVLGGTLRDALTLTDVDGLVTQPGTIEPTPTVTLLEDGSSLSPVQPGLTYEAAFLFEHDGSAPPPTDATVLLQQHTWGTDSLEGVTTRWLRPTTTLRGHLEVREAVSDAGADA
ncbi:hypothetical protein [Cellulomonas wangsupingiae]|uniref:DUF4352 domain-containing protein n=1 Tax=Cellulomonas wangsupingiae TaxID=2968085 RepID=A0ABY5K6Y6_9CELL|nr:hypothetical protein [Cellulomonas wangsupingiae]MCC2334839.1 hypothetical protein [Cellulomonas wangsupingiae]UUI66211.1 hypothetical protein NP075_05700 [Cellulomonas wangsupingiae]